MRNNTKGDNMSTSNSMDSECNVIMDDSNQDLLLGSVLPEPNIDSRMQVVADGDILSQDVSAEIDEQNNATEVGQAKAEKTADVSAEKVQTEEVVTENDIIDDSATEEVAEIEHFEDVSAKLCKNKKHSEKSQKAIAIFKKGFKRYFIDAFTGMAQGLFCTLIAGTILAQIGGWIQGAGTDAGMAVGSFIIQIANIAKMLMGAGIGIGIANSLGASKLVMFTASVAGMAGAYADKLIDFAFTASFLPGNPIGAYVVAVLAVEIGRLVSGKTKVDIVVVPLTMMIVSMIALYVAWPFIELVVLIGKGIAIATEATPFVMGVVIAVVMGVLLTLPTSSAAIWLAIAAPVLAVGSTAGADTQSAIALAGGAAVTGCACQMIGFAVQSYRENKFGGFIAQGIGTSMLQIPNLMRHPKIIIPPIVASAIAGPLATCVFKLRCNAAGGGMGTSGLVGIFGTIEESSGLIPDWQLGLGIFVCFFFVPVVVCLALSEIMRKTGAIKKDQMKLDL